MENFRINGNPCTQGTNRPQKSNSRQEHQVAKGAQGPSVFTVRFQDKGYSVDGNTTNTNFQHRDDGTIAITGKDNGTVILNPNEQKNGAAITFDPQTRTTQLVDIEHATVYDAETDGNNRFAISGSNSVRVDLDSTYNPETGSVTPNATGDNDAVAITNGSYGVTGQGTDYYIQRGQEDTNPFFMNGNKGFSNGDTRGFNIDE